MSRVEDGEMEAAGAGGADVFAYECAVQGER
jgi:hypothetical protein